MNSLHPLVDNAAVEALRVMLGGNKVDSLPPDKASKKRKASKEIEGLKRNRPGRLQKKQRKASKETTEGLKRNRPEGFKRNRRPQKKQTGREGLERNRLEGL